MKQPTKRKRKGKRVDKSRRSGTKQSHPRTQAHKPSTHEHIAEHTRIFQARRKCCPQKSFCQFCCCYCPLFASCSCHLSKTIKLSIRRTRIFCTFVCSLPLPGSTRVLHIVLLIVRQHVKESNQAFSVLFCSLIFFSFFFFAANYFSNSCASWSLPFYSCCAGTSPTLFTPLVLQSIYVFTTNVTVKR